MWLGNQSGMMLVTRWLVILSGTRTGTMSWATPSAMRSVTTLWASLSVMKLATRWLVIPSVTTSGTMW
jgi:hypothetical protein